MPEVNPPHLRIAPEIQKMAKKVFKSNRGEPLLVKKFLYIERTELIV